MASKKPNIVVYLSDLVLFSALCAVIICFCLACGDAERTTHIATAPEDVPLRNFLKARGWTSEHSPPNSRFQMAMGNSIVFQIIADRNSLSFSTAPAHEATVERNSASCRTVMRTFKPKVLNLLLSVPIG